MLGGQLARALARLDLGEPAHAALGLGHDLVGHHEHVAGGQVGGRRGRQQRGQVVARRKLGQAREGAEGERLGQAGTGGVRGARQRSSWRSAPRVEGA